MEICWANLEKIRLNKVGNFTDLSRKKVYFLGILAKLVMILI
jgi:hypothetical protein